MAGTAYQVKSFGDTIVHRKLMKLADRAGDMRPAWPAVTVVVARGYENSFRQEGPGWPALKASTERRRISEGYAPGPIRTRSGRDRREMTNPFVLQNDQRGTRHSLDIWGTAVAEMHQHGTRHMKSRPLKLTRYFQDQISLAIRASLMEAYGDG